MGIKGLWQALREYVDDGHLSQFRGQRVAVDMYVWLHRCVHRSVRIRTEAVVAFFDKKYGSITSHTDPNSQNSGGDAVPRISPSPPLSIDDVICIDDEFVTLVVEKVSALQRFGVIPVCVFDGTEMPMKGVTDEERRVRREEAFRDALVKLEQLYCEARRRRGYTAEACARGDRITLPNNTRLYEEAVQLLEKAVDISTELAHAVIQVLKEERHVECMVAPYEADAQLAYLCRQGYVGAAASEDSDLIAYYCPCIISKLDTFSGKCEVLQPQLCAPLFFQRMIATRANSSSVAASTLRPASAHMRATPVAATIVSGHDHVRNSSTDMRSAALQSLHRNKKTLGRDAAACAGEHVTSTSQNVFTYESFLLGCILSGCDYVPNLRSIGVKKAFKLVANSTSLRQCFTTLERDYGFPAEELRHYRKRVLEAFYCFAHHLVYSPTTHGIVSYHPLPASNGGTTGLKTQLVGDIWPSQIAQEVCVQCLKDPCTLQLYRGVYQACVSRYLQRTRRGQTSLKSYTGFEGLSSSRVVLRQEKSRRDEGDSPTYGSGTECFGAPLKKRRIGSDFIGHVAPPPPSSCASSHNMGAVVVRSRFFMVRRRTAVCEQWSTSETENEEEVGVGESKESLTVPRQASICTTDSAMGTRADGCIASLPTTQCTSSPSSILNTKTDDDVLADDAASGVVAAATISWQHTADRADGEGSSKMMDGGRSGDCIESHEHASRVCTASSIGGDDASACGASLQCTAISAHSSVDSESGRDAEFEVGKVRGAAPAVVVREGLQEDRCLGETLKALTHFKDSRQHIHATADAVEIPPESPALSPPRCDCPFGYWQCNRAHSVFESCFLGRHWSRDDGPRPPLPPSPNSPTARTSTSTHDSSAASPHPSPASPRQSSCNSLMSSACNKYVPRAFRPPRSTATVSPPPPLHTGEVKQVPPLDEVANANADDVAALHSFSYSACGAASSPASLLSSAFPSSPKDGDTTSCVAPPAPLSSRRAAVCTAMFEKMALKKI